MRPNIQIQMSKEKEEAIHQINFESYANQFIIQKFLQKGFDGLTAEELATALVNSTFTNDFKDKTKEDWMVNYLSKVVEKLKSSKFQIDWLYKQMEGQKDEHEEFFKTLRKGGKIDSILSYLRHNGNKVLFEHEHKSKMSPLHIAAMIGNESLAEFMINRQVPIDQRDKLLKTPLHHACEKGHQTMVELLLNQGASIYCQDSKGFTALHYAIKIGNNHILSLLTDKDAAMIFMPDYAQRTPMHHLALISSNCSLMVNRLITMGADVNAHDADKRTPLHLAAHLGNKWAVDLFVMQGALTHLKDCNQKSAMDLAFDDETKMHIITYSKPEYQPSADEIQLQESRRFAARNPRQPLPLEKKKDTKRKQKVKVSTLEHQVQTDPPLIKSKEKQREKLIELMRRVQQFGVDTKHYKQKPLIYSGKWMEKVHEIDDLMLQINTVTPNEAVCKLFNVLYPYQRPIPIDKTDDEQVLSAFYGKEDVQTIEDKFLNVQKLDPVEKPEDLLEISQEIVRLRQELSALNQVNEEKDKMIDQIQQDKERLKNSFSVRFEEENMKMKLEYRQLEKLYQKVSIDNMELRKSPVAEVYLQRENEKLKEKVNGLMRDLSAYSQDEEVRNIANLLLANGVRSAAQFMDKDNDQQITKDEMVESLKHSFGVILGKKRMDRLFDAIDLEKTGSIKAADFDSTFGKYKPEFLLKEEEKEKDPKVEERSDLDEQQESEQSQISEKQETAAQIRKKQLAAQMRQKPIKDKWKSTKEKAVDDDEYGEDDDYSDDEDHQEPKKDDQLELKQKELDEKISELEKKLEDFNLKKKKFDDEQNKFEKDQDKLEELEKEHQLEVEQFKKEKKDFDKLKKNQAAPDQSGKMIQDLNDLNKKLNQQIEQLNKEIENNSGDKDKKMVEELNAANKKLNAHVDHLNQEMEKLKKELEEAKDAQDQFGFDVKEQPTAKQAIAKQSLPPTEDNSKLEEENKQLKQNISEHTEKLSQLQKDHKNKDHQLKEHANKITQMQKDHDSKVEKLTNDYNKQLKSINQSKGHDKYNEVLRKENQDTKQQLEKANEEKNQLTQEHQEHNLKMEKYNESLMKSAKQKIDFLQDKVKTLETDKSKKDSNEKPSGKVDQKQLDSLKAENKEIKTQNKTLENTIDALKKQIQALKADQGKTTFEDVRASKEIEKLTDDKAKKIVSFRDTRGFQKIKNIKDKYSILSEIGSGAFGTVYKAKHLQADIDVAIKFMKKSQVDKDLIQQELQILEDTIHPNIVRMYELLHDDKWYYVVSELCITELFQLVEERHNIDDVYQPFNEADIKKIAQQIFYGLNYMHKMDICHRDVKPENILILDKQSLVIKISDFGFSTYMRNVPMDSWCGSTQYMAPEILDMKPYDEKIDIWAAACTIFFLFKGDVPFFSEEETKKAQYELNDSHISGDAKDLLAKCFEIDPKKRVSAFEALEHPWFKSLSKNEPTPRHVQEALLNFVSANDFAKSMVSVLVGLNAQQEDIEKAQQLFMDLDKDKNGYLSIEELKSTMRRTLELHSKVTDEQVDAIIKKIDLNNDGKIDFQEFLQGTIDHTSLLNDEALTKAFNMLDKNNDGHITREELQGVFARGNKETSKLLDDIIAIADINKDGNLSLQEFKSAIKSLLTNKFQEKSQKIQHLGSIDEQAKRIANFRDSRQITKINQITEKYKLGKKLGEGSFGKVFEAQHLKADVTVAIKFISKDSDDEQLKEMFKNELQILNDVLHANIVRMFELLENDSHYYIVTEVMAGGDLYDLIEDRDEDDKPFTQAEIKKVIYQLFYALNYMHQMGLVHRDVKPENILIADAQTLYIKVADMGLSAYMNGKPLSGNCGSLIYFAPEQFGKSYDEKVDVWAAGCVLYQLLTGEMAFKNWQDAMNYKLEKLDIAGQEITSQAKDLLYKIFEKDPKKRLSAKQVLEHEFFKDQEEDKKPISKEVQERLGQYCIQTNFTRTMLSLLAGLKAQTGDIEKAQQMFMKLDTNKDGHLQIAELRQTMTQTFLQNFDLNEKQIENLIQKMDLNKDGKIDFQEFLQGTIDQCTLLNQESVEAAFKLLDKDNDGKVTIDELNKVFNRGESQNQSLLEELIKEADKDNDKKVSLQEFKNATSIILKNAFKK